VKNRTISVCPECSDQAGWFADVLAHLYAHHKYSLQRAGKWAETQSMVDSNEKSKYEPTPDEVEVAVAFRKKWDIFNLDLLAIIEKQQMIESVNKDA
jgi:hypothetical protein